MSTAQGMQDRVAYSEQVLAWGRTTEELWFFSRQKETTFFSPDAHSASGAYPVT
jgi:hypothetical protein